MAKMTILYTPDPMYPHDFEKIEWDTMEEEIIPPELSWFRDSPFSHPRLLKGDERAVVSEGLHLYQVVDVGSPIFDENRVYCFDNKKRPDSDAGILILESWHKEGSGVYLYLFSHLGKKYVMSENDLYDYLATDKPFPRWAMWLARIRAWTNK